jgi:hypothetical protein
LVERLMALTGVLAIASLVLPTRLDLTPATAEAEPLRVLS